MDTTNISYETLRALALALPPQQRHQLAAELTADKNLDEHTFADKVARMQAAILDTPVLDVPSIRREEWYGDDGR